jgi:DNA-binding transcriptional ArsR family regulator
MVHQYVNYRGVRSGVSDVDDQLDRVFTALGNRHRREMVQLLVLHPHSISQLARARALSLPAIHKHVRILEEAAIVRRRKFGRTTFLSIDRSALLRLQDWLAQYHAYWGTESETLENYEPFLTRDEPRR